ncbi:MAG: carboxypeptidase C (cathepsin A), partial [Gammaproteobacteria bacterium]
MMTSKRHPIFPALLPVLFLATCLPGAWAQEDPESEQAPAAEEADGDTSISHHRILLGGEWIDYTAEAGTLTLKDEDGGEKAHIFYVAYTRDDVKEVNARPLTFTFNGGPGSSSVWLHLGAFGPRRVKMGAEGFPLAPPAQLVDNDFSLLDVTDLVFIDPVTTGYSRAAKGEDPQQFHGVDEDVEVVGEFIRRYTTRTRRWSSPKYLCGESYGTTRAAGLAKHLQQRHGMYLNGIVLVSSILEFQTARFDVGNDLPFVLFLPTYAATAWYHGQLGEEFAEIDPLLREVESFALGEYATALLRGNQLTDSERRAIADRLARYTGLSVEYILSTNLRINISRFVKELRRDERITVGRL